MPDFSVAGRRVVVVGAARSGVAAAELLVSRGAHVILSDVRPALDQGDVDRLRAAGIELELGGHVEITFTSADLIVVSPGVPSHLPCLEAARRAGVAITGELELASRCLQGRIVAITGTKGKSTTTALTGRILEAGGLRVLVGGNIGTALSAQVDGSAPDVIHVVEASSFQLESIETFHPWIAVFLNFSPDHLDRHASVSEYAAAKARIFERQTEQDWAVVNADDPFVLELARRGRARILPFAIQAPLEAGIAIGGDAIVRRLPEGPVTLVPLSAIRLLGPHLRADVMAAAAVGCLAGVSPAAMTKAVEEFSGLEHALEPVGEIDGVRFVNDSKATNVEAARRAVESFDRGVVAILGGRFKGGDFGDLRAPLAGRGRAVVAIGEAAPLIRQALAGALPVLEASSMRDAVRAAFTVARPDGTVLLAPACSSFDMFRDYADRGRSFRREVEALAKEWRKDVREQ
jgi:UDP-N-acetylmuramoylalanine--D-glutamate ligase